MDWLPFVGSDDEEANQMKSDDGDMTIETNYDNVNIVGAQSSSTRSKGGLRVHTISLGDDGDTTSTGGSDMESRRTAPSPSSTTDGPTSPPSSTVDPEPTADPYSRGTFVLPNDRDFMQKLEARGTNGHGEMVETVYVITGPTYTQPTDMIRLDNEEYFVSATKTSVSFKTRKMARAVARLFPDDEPPKVIARFHTHPGGTLRPSQKDKESASAIEQSFEDAFETDDFEFFHGIHGLEEHGRSPGPDKRQSPSDSRGHINWLGERYRHKIAVYGHGFRQQKDVGIH